MKICTIFIAQSIAVLSRTWPGLGLGRPTYDLEYGYCYSTKGSYKFTRRFLYPNCYNYCTLMKLLIYFCKGWVAKVRVHVCAKSILKRVCDVSACGSFWACDVPLQFCTLLGTKGLEKCYFLS